MWALAFYFVAGFLAILAIAEMPKGQRLGATVLGLLTFILWPLLVPLTLLARRAQ